MAPRGNLMKRHGTLVILAAGVAVIAVNMCLRLVLVSTSLTTTRPIPIPPPPQQQQHQQHWKEVLGSNATTTIPANHAALPLPASPISIPTSTPDVILFMHMAKTGGTTIREYLKSLPNVHYRLVTNPRQVKNAFRNLQDKLWAEIAAEQKLLRLQQQQQQANGTTPATNRNSHPPPKRKITRVLELHAGVGLKQYFDLVKRLRNVVAQTTSNATATTTTTNTNTKRTIFVLHVAREPLGFHRSYFRYFHHRKCTFSWCGKKKFEAHDMTDENMVQVMKTNHQTTVLAGEQIFDNDNEAAFHGFLRKVLETFDWIGTTDQLSNTTIPLLSALLTSSTIFPKNYNANAGASAQVQITDNPAVHSLFSKRTEKDRMFYNWVRQAYVLPPNFLEKRRSRD